MNFEYFLHQLVVAIPMIAGAIALAWGKIADVHKNISDDSKKIHSDAEKRREKTCAENAAILFEVDQLRTALDHLVGEVQFLTHGAREVEEENQRLHTQAVQKDNEIAKLERRITAVSAEQQNTCNCLYCMPQGSGDH